MKKKIKGVGPFLVLGLAFLVLVFLNIFYHDHWLDSDMAAEMIFSKLLAEEGHIFATPDWYYSTEFRFLYTQLIMGPLFRILDDWHLIRAITNVVTYVLMIGSYFYMMKPLQVKREWTALTGTILLLPFSETMITHVQMGNTYMPHIIILFFFFGLYLRLVQKEDRKGKFLWNLAAFVALAVICGVSGVRYLLAMQCPLVLTAFLYLLGSLEFGQFRSRFGSGEAGKAFRTMLKSDRARYLYYGLLGAAGGILGYGINVAWVSRQYVFQTYEATNFIAVYQGILWERLQNAIGSLLMLFGYIPDKGFLSLRGIISMISFVLIAVLAYCVVRVCKRSEGQRFFTALFVVTAFVVNVFVFVFTTSTMVPRYYITILIFVLPVLAFYFEGKELLFDKWVVGALLVVCLSLSSAKITLSYLSTDKNEKERPVAEFLSENGYTFGYASYWHANILTELTDGAVEAANILDPECLEYFKWSSPMKYYERGYHQGEVFLLLTAEEMDQFQDAKALDRGEKIYDDGGFAVFVYGDADRLFGEDR